MIFVLLNGGLLNEYQVIDAHFFLFLFHIDIKKKHTKCSMLLY